MAVRRNSSTTWAERGARPRLVCRITPEALITGCSDGANSFVHGIHDALFDGRGVQNFIGQRFPGRDLAPQTFQNLAGRFHHEAALHLATQRYEARAKKEFIHRGHAAKESSLLGGKIGLGAGSHGDI